MVCLDVVLCVFVENLFGDLGGVCEVVDKGFVLFLEIVCIRLGMYLFKGDVFFEVMFFIGMCILVFWFIGKNGWE